MAKVLSFNSTLLTVRQLTPRVRHFRFSTPEGFTFTPGQYVMMQISLPGGLTVKKQYSISSTPADTGYLETTVTQVEGGRSSTYLHSLSVGAAVAMQGPFGLFTVREHERGLDKVFISTGTGITPFRSMIPSLLAAGATERILLLTGYRFEDGVLFQDEWQSLAKRHKNFSHHATISRPADPAFKGQRGRVQTLVKELVQEDFTGVCYLCGLSEMITEAAQLLLSMGVQKERIRFERYD